MLPAYVRIMGIDCSIEENATISSFEQPGVADCPSHEILISPNLSDEGKTSVLLHECLEMMNYFSQIGLKHRQITAVASGFYQLFADNPELLDMFDEDVELEEE